MTRFPMIPIVLPLVLPSLIGSNLVLLTEYDNFYKCWTNPGTYNQTRAAHEVPMSYHLDRAEVPDVAAHRTRGFNRNPVPANLCNNRLSNLVPRIAMSQVNAQPTPLQSNYVPDQFVNRQEVKAELRVFFSDLRETTPQNVHLYGERGQGKTHLIYSMLEELPYRVNTCYVPCTKFDSQYTIFQQIYHAVTQEQINNGHHTAELKRRIEDRIGAIPTVVVLDEVDFLLMNDGDDLLYTLSRIDTQESLLCIITISAQTQDLGEHLEERTYSSLYPQTINVEPYTAEELCQILAERGQKALAEQSLHREALHYITSTTSNASFGLSWLKTAAESTDSVITGRLVKQVEGQAFQNYADRLLQDFTEHHHLLFQSIQELSTEQDVSIVQTGTIYDRYQDLCQTHSENSLSNRRTSDYLKHLELLNLIEADYHYGGRKGKTRDIRITGYEGKRKPDNTA